MNQIVEVKLTLMTDGHWKIEVTKAFAPEYGGGTQTFTETAPQIHRALDIAREMVTVSPGTRTDV